MRTHTRIKYTGRYRMYVGTRWEIKHLLEQNSPVEAKCEWVITRDVCNGMADVDSAKLYASWEEALAAWMALDGEEVIVLSDADIGALRIEAGKAGDLETVKLCLRAQQGCQKAMAALAEHIRAAEAMLEFMEDEG